MSKTEIFLSYYPKSQKQPANFRYRAREAAVYFGGLAPDVPDETEAVTSHHYGRSSGSNN
jgi:hypothetical protein